MLGVFGSIFSAIQGLPLELPGVLAAQWTPAAVLPFVGFGLAMFSFYSLVPYQLSWGGATMLNLSLLSSDLWTALARLLFFGGFSLWSGASFLVSFALLAAGIAVYSMHGDAKRPEGDAESHALPVAYARVGSTEAPHYGGLTVDEEGPGGRPHLQTLAGAREKLVPLRPPGRMMYEATELSSSL